LHSATDAQSHALLLGRRGAAEKVAAFLLEWMGRSGEPALAALPMSRQDMADYLGLTIETVSRTLSQFEREGLISIPNARQIRIARCAALQDLTA
jgi:CRP/FNR family nitrogen fixation transcriptional regulator